MNEQNQEYLHSVNKQKESILEKTFSKRECFTLSGSFQTQ